MENRVQEDDDQKELVLPSGYKFSPTNLELVLYYLKNKIMGQELPADIIPTIDVFSSNPDQLPLSEFKYGMPNEWYFFSCKRKGRILTEDGFYHASSRDTIFDKNGVIVGYIRTLDFHLGRPHNAIKTQWTIQEFRVNPELIQVNKDDRATQKKITNFVACKIINQQCDSISLQTKTKELEHKISTEGLKEKTEEFKLEIWTDDEEEEDEDEDEEEEKTMEGVIYEPKQAQ